MTKKKETRQEKYKRTHPWVRYVEWARRRCKDVASKWYEHYGARGITCDLAAADVKILWLRDQAYKLQRPSLDRIDSSKGYSLENCRFIEFILNARMGWDPRARQVEIEL